DHPGQEKPPVYSSRLLDWVSEAASKKWRAYLVLRDFHSCRWCYGKFSVSCTCSITFKSQNSVAQSINRIRGVSKGFTLCNTSIKRLALILFKKRLSLKIVAS